MAPSAATISSPVISDAPTVVSDTPSFMPSLPMSMPPVSLTWTTIPYIGAPIPSSSSTVPAASNPFATVDEIQPHPWEPPPTERQTDDRRASFGSVFPGSSGTGGNGHGNGSGGGFGINSPQVYQGAGGTFQIGTKPKDPPVDHGRTNEDVDTWIAKVQDFLYLTEANPRQQVAYTATFLQEAAAD